MSNYYSSSNNLDYGYYVRLVKSAILSSYKKVILMSILVGVITFLYSLTFEPEYRATTVLHVAPIDSAVFDLREILLKRRDPAFRATQIGIIRSRILVKKVVDKLGLETRAEFVAEKSSLLDVLKQKAGLVKERSVKDLSRNITNSLLENIIIDSEQNSNLLNISLTFTNPQLAADITNTLANEYIKSVESAQRVSTESSEVWLLERLNIVNSDLKKAELALQEFKEKENIIGSSEQSDGFATQEVDIITGRLLEARQKRLSSESLYQQITSTERRNGDLQGIAAIQNDSTVQNIRADLVQLESRQGELSQRYGPQHRRMIELSSEIDAIKLNLKKQVGRVVSSLKSEYELAKESESFLNNSLGKSTNKIQSLGRKQYGLLSLEQDVRTQRDVYQAFLKRLNQSKAAGVSVNQNVRITDPAVAANRPLPSKGLLIVVMFSILTAIFGFGLALLKELFDNTISNDSDVSNKLSQTSLGSVPEINDVVDSEGYNVAYHYFNENKTSQFAEAVRTIRSSLMLSSIDEKKRRILFTSSAPGEGKTSMSISTALAFGQVQKTLLIDCDLRRPSLDKLLNKKFDRRPLGLSDLCLGTSMASECIHHLEEGGIDLLPSGTVNPNPQELFCSTRFSELLNKLNEVYDVIIIDSPPCAGLSDAMLLSTHVDQVAYVVKAGVTPVAKIRSVLEAIKSIDGPLAGVIVNKVLTTDFSYNYYYGHDYYADSVQKNEADEVKPNT